MPPGEQGASMTQHQLEVLQIAFPSDLPDDRCQLRLVVEIRYVKKGQTAYDSFVLPGSESFWNCKAGQGLRDQQADHVELDIAAVPEWDKTAYFDASSINRVRVTLYDTQGDGFWSKAEEGVKDLLKAYLGVEDSGGVGDTVGEVLSDKMGSGSGNGKKLFQKDLPYTAGSMAFSGPGKIPDNSSYTVRISL